MISASSVSISLLEGRYEGLLSFTADGQLFLFSEQTCATMPPPPIGNERFCFTPFRLWVTCQCGLSSGLLTPGVSPRLLLTSKVCRTLLVTLTVCEVINDLLDFFNLLLTFRQATLPWNIVRVCCRGRTSPIPYHASGHGCVWRTGGTLCLTDRWDSVTAALFITKYH